MKRTMEQSEDTFKLSGMYVAEVVAVDDPKKRDRVRVRVHGIMDSTVEASACPWAEQCGAIFSGEPDQVGFSTVPKVGSLVYVMFLYGDPSLPIYHGYVRGGKDGSGYHTLSDIPSSSILGPEPASLDGNAQYPLNNVVHTDAGVMMFDETPGNERIAIKHKSGAYIEIRPDGAVVYKSASDSYHIVSGKETRYIDGDETTHITGAKDETIDGNEQVTISGGYNLSASNISLN